MSITELSRLSNEDVKELGQAWVKEAKVSAPEKSVRLGGVLYLSKSGWLLLKVPNALIYGAFDALDEPGVQLPTKDTNDPSSPVNGHISVMRPEEIEQIGGPDKITERGKVLHYTLGPLKTVVPHGWDDMSRVWFIEVDSPELKAMRKSYGLTPLPKNNEFQFHITVAVRRKNVLRENEVAKSSEHDSVIKSVQEIVDGDTIFRELGGGYGYVHWNPDLRRLHLVSADWHDNEDVRTAKALLDDVDGVDEVTCDAEYYPKDVAWTRIQRGEEPREIPKQEPINWEEISKMSAADVAEIEQEAMAAQIAEANETLTARHRANLKGIIEQMQQAKRFSDVGNYSEKRRILGQLMQQSPQDWVIDQPEPKHPGITHKPTNFRFHINRGVIPPQVPKTASIAGQTLLNTPIQFSGHRSLSQNLLDHAGKMHGTFTQRVQSKQYANRIGMANNRMAQLDHLQNLLDGNDTVITDPTDKALARVLGIA